MYREHERQLIVIKTLPAKVGCIYSCEIFLKTHIFNIANLQFVLKTCNPTIKRAKISHRSISFRISLPPFANQTYWCEKAALVLWFLCSSPVSKWLLYRQRGAVCCKMLLRHNWVRLVHSKRRYVFRTFHARVSPTIDTGGGFLVSEGSLR